MKNNMVFEQELHNGTIAVVFGINHMEVKHNNSDLCSFSPERLRIHL